MKYELLEITNSEAFEDEYIQGSIPTKNSEEFKQDILKNICNTDISKETIMKRLKKNNRSRKHRRQKKNKQNKSSKFHINIIKTFQY